MKRDDVVRVVVGKKFVIEIAGSHVRLIVFMVLMAVLLGACAFMLSRWHPWSLVHIQLP